jgi:hypothetical protein
VDNPGGQGSKRAFPAVTTEETAIGDSVAYESSKETPTALPNEAPAVSSGGVGAVRRVRRLRGRARALSIIAVVALFVSGAGYSVRSFAAAGPQHLSAVHFDRGGPASGPADRIPASIASPTTASTAAGPVPTTAAEPPSTAPAEPPAVDRPIVAPANIPRIRSTGARSVRTAYPVAPREGGVWAVVVGIDDYPGTDADLKAAVADAREVDSAMAAYNVPLSHRLVLLDKDATGDNIRGALRWMTARATVDSTAVFFYSGHVRKVTGDPAHDGRYVDEAIVGSDGDNVYSGEVADILRGLEARTAWLGIAACYGGGFDDVLAPGRVLTAAAGENDVAYENSGLGHSYMVEYMIHRAMVEGKAAGSVQEAFTWAKAQIAHDYPNRQPVMIDRSRGPVVLGRPVPAAPDNHRSSATAQPPSQSKNPQPGPSAPPPTAPEPQPGQKPCAEVLSVTVCSDKRSSGPPAHGGSGHHTPARPRAATGPG